MSSYQAHHELESKLLMMILLSLLLYQCYVMHASAALCFKAVLGCGRYAWLKLCRHAPCWSQADWKKLWTQRSSPASILLCSWTGSLKCSPSSGACLCTSAIYKVCQTAVLEDTAAFYERQTYLIPTLFIVVARKRYPEVSSVLKIIPQSADLCW